MADLENLTRYDYVPGEAGRMVIGHDDEGGYLLRADVLALARRAAQPVAPEKLTRSMCGTKDYCEGWNDCVDEFHLATPAPASAGQAAPAVVEPAGWRAFIENIATPYSEPLNSISGYKDKASRQEFMGILRTTARELLSAQPTERAAAPADQAPTKIKCLRDEAHDQNMQGPCSAGRCEWPNCYEPVKRRATHQPSAQDGGEA